MNITGRLTTDAVVNETKSGKKVVNFCVVVNDSYKPKNGERQRVATYYNCSYWLSEKLAQHLKKSTLVEVSGRIYAAAYVDKDGVAKASIKCHVERVKILAWPQENSIPGKVPEDAMQVKQEEDDLPF